MADRLNAMAFSEHEILGEVHVPVIDAAALDDALARVAKSARSRVLNGFGVEPVMGKKPTVLGNHHGTNQVPGHVR